MGWLRRLAKERAFRAIATNLAKEFPRRWGNADSLRNALGKLDKSEDFSPLGEPGFLPALARSLSCDPAELEQCARVARAAADPHAFRFDELDFTIDLLKERPFPGVPEEVLAPSGWRRLWWYAPSGAGKDFVGRWLTARALATVAQGTSFDPGEIRPLYVLATRADLNAIASVLAEFPKDRPLCVAAAFPRRKATVTEPDAERPLLDPWPKALVKGGWRDVKTPPLGSWLDPLLEWVASHVVEGGGLAEDGAIEAITRFVEKEPQAFETPGHVLGLCGLIEECGPAKLASADNREHARALVKIALRRAGERSDVPSVLRKQPEEVLLSLARAILCRSDAPSTDGLSRDAIEDLLPPKLRLPDVEGAREVARRRRGKGGANAEAALDEIGLKLAPSGRVLVEALIEFRILEPRGKGFGMRPWVESLALARAAEDLVCECGRDLGEALLRPHAAPLVLTQLHAAFARGDFAALKEALAHTVRADPASIAALEGAFRAIGIAVLEGAAPPQGLLEVAWRREFDVAMPARPGGRLPPFPLLYWPGEGQWLHMGTWFLAALAISERIRASAPIEFAYWTSDGPAEVRPGFEYIIQQIEAASSFFGRPPWWFEAFDMGRRLLERGLSLPEDRGDLLAVPAVVAAVKERKPVPPGRDIGWLLRDPRSGTLELLDHQARKAGLSRESIIGALWDGYARAPASARLNFQGLAAEDQRELWRLAPAELVGDRLRLFPLMLSAKDAPHEATTPEQWRAFLATWDPMEDAPLFRDVERSQAWFAMPNEILEEAVRAGKLSSPHIHELREWAWRRIPKELLAQALTWVQEGNLERMIKEVPPERWGSFLGPVRERLPRAGEAERGAALIWLHLFVTRRGGGWREAFVLLEEMRSSKA